MRLGQVFIAAVLLSLPLRAYADTLSTFSFTGSAVTYGLAGDFDTISGVTTIDTTSGVVQSLSFTELGSLQSGVRSQAGAEVFVGSSLSAFSFSEASLIGYMGSTFNLRTPIDLYVGSTTLTGTSSTPPPIAAAPEPTSFVMVGTALVGLAGAIRRRVVGCTSQGAASNVA